MKTNDKKMKITPKQNKKPKTPLASDLNKAKVSADSKATTKSNSKATSGKTTPKASHNAKK